MILDSQKEIDYLKRLLTASEEVISTLENKNDHLNSKSEFYEEVAESLVTENESLLLKIQQIKEQYNPPSIMKKVSFNIEPAQNVELGEGEDTEEEGEAEEAGVEEERETEYKPVEETGYIKQSGRVRCIVCGYTKSQMNKHMEKHKQEGEMVTASQVHCALEAFPQCPFQCSSKEDLLKHIETAHKQLKCNNCNERFDTKAGLEKHIKKTHTSTATNNKSSVHPENSSEANSELKCNICGLVCNTPKEMEDHMDDHEDTDE